MPCSLHAVQFTVHSNQLIFEQNLNLRIKMLTSISSREVTLSFYLVTNLSFTNMNEVFFHNNKNCKHIYDTVFCTSLKIAFTLNMWLITHSSSNQEHSISMLLHKTVTLKAILSLTHTINCYAKTLSCLSKPLTKMRRIITDSIEEFLSTYRTAQTPTVLFMCTS